MLPEAESSFLNGDMTGIITLDDWIAVWLEEVAPQAVKPTTVSMYAKTLSSHVQPYIGTTKMSVLNEDTIREWFQVLQKRYLINKQGIHMTEGTLKNILSVLRGCLRDACKYRLLQENPCKVEGWSVVQKNVWDADDSLTEDELAVAERFMETYCTVDGFPLGIGYQLILYAMRAVRAGASSDIIAELMGFSSSRQVIRRYMPHMSSDKQELVERMCGK